MPYLNEYRLLISHSWNYSSQFDTIVSWFNQTANFKWSNYSVSGDAPLDVSSTADLKEKLTKRIAMSNAVIVVSGMYATYSKWIDFEIDEALRMGKPIIGIRPWGQERTPTKIQDCSTVLVGWNSASVVEAVRTYAK